jgi:hypothetical protein
MRLAIVIGACCLISGAMRAGPITFQFTGTVTQVPVDGLFGDIEAGQNISGNYTFESTSIDGDPADPAIGSYRSPSGDPYSFNVTVGSHSFSTNFLLGVGVFNAAQDQYTVLAEDGGATEMFSLFLQNQNGTVFSNDVLPLSAPPLNVFSPSLVAFQLDVNLPDGEVQVDGTIDSLSSAAVPEPSTLSFLLLAAGLAGAWIAKRREPCEKAIG